MAAGIATLELLCEKGAYEELERLSARLADGLAGVFAASGVPHTQTRVGAMFSSFFCDREVRDHHISEVCDLDAFNRFFWGIVEAAAQVLAPG